MFNYLVVSLQKALMGTRLSFVTTTVTLPLNHWTRLLVGLNFDKRFAYVLYPMRLNRPFSVRRFAVLLIVSFSMLLNACKSPVTVLQDSVISPLQQAQGCTSFPCDAIIK